MKTSLVIGSLLGIALAAGIAVHFSGKKALPASPTVTEPASDLPNTAPAGMDASKEPNPRTPPQNADEATQVSAETPAASDTPSEPAAPPAPQPTPFSQAIDTLVSPQVSFAQKQVAWKQLEDAGQLDEAIEALKQGATNNPSSAAYPAALGQAQLRKAGVVSRNGGSISEMGILGMQADQNLDAALKLDPANWEAQFFKAAAMSYWPLELNKGEEVVQRLSHLIDQQNTMPPEPQFAQTYLVLGNQYQKMGKPDYAAATWQLGAQKFPGSVELQQKIKGQ